MDKSLMKDNQHALLLFIAFFFSISLLAGEKSVNIEGITTFRHLAPQALLLEDENHLYSPRQILLDSGLTDNYIQSSSEIPYMDFTSSTYWMKIEVENNSNTELNYYIELARPLTNLVRLYVYTSDGELVRVHEAGDNFTFCKREYEHRKFIFPQEFPPHSKRILIVQTKSDGEILKLPIRFWTVDAFTQFVSQENFFLGLYYGIFILVIILFSLFGLALGERLYVYFVSYVFALAIFQFSLDGLSFQYLWRGLPWLGNHAILIFAALSMIGMFLYVRQFLRFANDFPRYNKGYTVFLGLFGISLLISLTEGWLYRHTFPFLNGLSFLAVLYVLLGIYLKAKKEKKVEVPILLAFISLTISSILFILCNVDFIHSEFFASNSLKLGSGLEVIFLSIAMAGRYRTTQQEKIEAQEEVLIQLEEINELKSQQTEKLEREVKERTKEIQHKNVQLSTQNKEILNSINYAQRLQDAILPTDSDLNKALPNSSLYFQPKDIVSGDFYWMLETPSHVYFAVADCTGHGVPGAMVSVLGYNSLNRCIQEFNLNEAGAILNKLRELVIETFSSEKIKVSDGMDIALCVWNKQTELQFAGAYNPIYFIRKGELQEIKGDKQPIGYFEKSNPFTTHYFNLEKGDSVVLFSDGYADQFGGPSGKKYKYSRFKDLLLKMNTDAPLDWRLNMENELLNWRGKEEQIDDICVMRIKF